MRLMLVKVIDGKVVLDEPLPEGTMVTIVANEEVDTFDLGPDEEAALLASIAEADRGMLIDGEELLRELRSRS